MGTAGTVAAANALNCYLERDSDRFMARTASRPLPAGRLQPAVALGFGLGLGALSVLFLWLAVNEVAAALALLAIGSYVLVYTPLKRRTHWAMWFGAVPGALPPLIGWTAATGGELERGGVALFLLMFVWQLPHFLAIALFRKDEYRSAGLLSVPLARGDLWASAELNIHLMALLPISTLPYLYGVAGPIYLAVALALGLAAVMLARRGLRQEPPLGWARRVFFFSLAHLSGIFLALLVDGPVRG